MTTQNTSDGTPTPEKVETLATQAVKLDRTALIGIFGAEQNPRALIRLPMGQTQTVAVGDQLNGGTVTAIGADQLVLSHSSGLKIMHMPRG